MLKLGSRAQIMATSEEVILRRNLIHGLIIVGIVVKKK